MLVVGAGLIGLAVADALAARGTAVTLVSESRPGEASAAGAGMLAPTVEPHAGATMAFAIASRERYPAYVRALEERTGVAVPLDRAGVLELAHSEACAARLRALARDDVPWLDPREVAELEPALASTLGALFHPHDGWVDNVVLLRALERAVASRREIRRIEATVVRLERMADGGGALRLASGDRIESRGIVLAAGAWSAQLEGLPRALPIEPARGQMIALGARAPRHVVYSEDAYLVPRADERTLVGATMERVGYDSTTSAAALQRLHREGAHVAPILGDAPVVAAWAGLRPMTPDGLPILGPDPDWPALLYASGHSRNGILMAPLTGDCIAALALGEEPPADLSAFSVERFFETARAG